MQCKILTDRKDLKDVVTGIRAAGLEDAVAPGIVKPSYTVWLQHWQNAYVLEVSEYGEVIGWSWLDNLNGESARIHFALKREYHDKAAELGNALLSWIAEHIGVTVFLAECPHAYRHTRNLMGEWGFEEVCVVPRGAYIARRDKTTSNHIYMRG